MSKLRVLRRLSLSKNSKHPFLFLRVQNDGKIEIFIFHVCLLFGSAFPKCYLKTLHVKRFCGSKYSDQYVNGSCCFSRFPKHAAHLKKCLDVKSVFARY
jgi:hypothetical protein